MNTRPALALSVLVLLAILAPEPVPAGPAAEAPSIRPFLALYTPRFPVLLPDGSLLAIDRPDGVQQLWRTTPRHGGADALDPAGATRTRLTDYPDGLSNYSVSPDGRYAVLMHARGGNENTQLTLLDLAGGATTPVLANPAVQASVNVWLRDGSGFVYSANDASPNDFSLYRWDLASRASTRLLAREGSWRAVDVTADGKRLLVNRTISASDIQSFELDAATGALREISVRPATGTAASPAVGYLPGEMTVLVRSDRDEGRTRLFVRDLASDSVREAAAGRGAFVVENAVISSDRARLATVTNEGGYGVIHVWALPDFRALPAPTEERGVGTIANFRGATLTWALSNARRPGEAFATTYAAKSGAAPSTRRLTFVDPQGIDLAAFRLPEMVRYKAFDGREIPAFLFLPASWKKGVPIPFVVTYHGGPEGQHRPSFEPLTQYLLSRGYGVLLPNVRGSTGYGREFQMLDDYRKRWDSVRDGVDAAEWLVARGYATPGRIATYGQSYGGYMAVATLVEDAERVERGTRPSRVFGACVDNVGIVNMKTFLEETSGYRRKLREAEYGPLSDTAFLDSVSSIRKVDKIKVPVFIAHGFNDPRVPVQEAMQLATALKAQGNQPRLFVAPDEGHGFQKLDNRIYFYERMGQFLDETIGREPATASAAN